MKPRIFFAIAAIYTLALASCSPDDEPQLPGIPINGVRWAPMNVAAPGRFAAVATDPGMFYQWGRRTGWSFADPLVSSPAGNAWNSTEMAGEVWDTAADPCPEGWRLPTQQDFRKLLDTDMVRRKWSDDGSGGGVSIPGWNTRATEQETDPQGIVFTDGTTGERVFFPAAGMRYREGGAKMNDKTDGFYWSTWEGDGQPEGNEDWPGEAAFFLWFFKDLATSPPSFMYGPARPEGYSVRCVLK